MSGSLAGVWGLIFCLALAAPVRGQHLDFDIRDLPPAAAGVRIATNRHGLPKTYFRGGRALTAPARGAAEDLARAFLRANRAVFPFTTAEVDGLRLASKDNSGRAVFVVFQQTWNGIDVFNGQIKVTLNDAGEVLHAGVDDAAPQLAVTNTRRLTVEEAIGAAYDSLRIARPTLVRLASENGKTRFRNPRGERFQPITADLAVFPISAATGRLVHRLSLEIDEAGWYEILIDADDGRLLFRHNLYEYAAQGRVWPQSPLADTARQLATFPESWLPAGATATTGNHVDAYLDANGDGRPDNLNSNGLSAGRASSAEQLFDFPFGDGITGQNPRNFQAAALTNLFYLVNKAHDYFYDLGFTEAAGNFQSNNFGRGGAGNDPVLAEAQSSLVVNNASFATPADGTSPRMRLGIFTRGTSTQVDDLDSAFDGGIVIHEYTHGVSSRLVGARVSSSCLSGVQSRAMGEGWSDYFASSFYNNPVHGAYVTQNLVSGTRRFSYFGYPYTYEDLGNEGFEVHDDGEIWAAALWDLRTTLGQAATDRLVVDGLKATPCRPTMTDARDAILAADAASNAGANRARIWQVFARHGLGFSAGGIDGQTYPGIYYNAAFDQPVDLQGTPNPAILGAPPASLPRAGDPYSYTVAASNPAGGALTFALSQGPAGMTIDGGGTLRWTAGYAQERVKVTVTDGKGGKVAHGFILTPDTPLIPGSAVAIDGARDSTGYFHVVVPEGSPIVQFTIRGGAGDADLDVFDPDGINYASFQDGNDETISIPTPKAGRWRVVFTGFRAFTGASLMAAVVNPTRIEPNAELTGLSGVTSSEVFYRFTVPAGAASLSVTTFGGTGDVDLYLRRGLPATCQASTVVTEPCPRDVLYSENEGNAEAIQVTSPVGGDWYIALTAYEGYSGVTLVVSATMPATVSAAPEALLFRQSPGGSAPAAQTFELRMTGGSASWTAEAVASGGNWLTVSPASGSGPATLRVSVSGASLAPGTYGGAITVTAPGTAGSPLSVAVTLTVAELPRLTPVIPAGGVIGGGGSLPVVTTISPGGLASLFGSGFAQPGTARAVQVSDLVNRTLPSSLADTCVLVDGKRAFLTYVSPGQINFQVPAVSLDKAVEVQVAANCGAPNEARSAAATAQTAAASPELLYWTRNGDGRNPVIAVNAVTGAYIGSPGLIAGATFTPARPGDILTIYGISFGPTSPHVAPGEAPSAAGATANAASVSVGGVELGVDDILYAGVSPGIAGLYQLNIRVPSELPDGDHAVVLRLGAFRAPGLGFVTVRR